LSSDFLQSDHCVSRMACRTCRAVPAWRKAVGAPDECPYGVTLQSLSPSAATPSAKIIATSSPSLAQKAVNFVSSAAKHVAAGAPLASEEEVARRFAICQSCEFYDGKACEKCGCPVVREKKFISKLSWANESCPVGKWGKAAD